MEVYRGMDGKLMNMKRIMECKIWIACQDQIDGRIMDVCMDKAQGIWKVHVDG